METNVIKLISEFGAIGLAAFLAYVYWKTVSNHLSHTNDALNRLEVAVTKLNEFLETKLK